MKEPTIEELRKWSAENVMGWEVCSCQRGYIDFCDGYHPYLWEPNQPSTGQIWQFIGKMVELGYELRLYKPTGKSFQYSAEFMDDKTVLDDNPCLAILRAGYKAFNDEL